MFEITRTEKQREVFDWVRTRLGENVALNTKERAMRLLEEVLELCQVEEIEPEEVIALMDHVNNKPVGEAPQELGGVGITILAYAAAKGLSADDEETKELRRIQSKSVDHFRARHQLKVDAGVAASMDIPHEA